MTTGPRHGLLGTRDEEWFTTRAGREAGQQMTEASIPKVTRPALARVSSRMRLFRRLGVLLRRSPIVWVSAPAGS